MQGAHAQHADAALDGVGGLAGRLPVVLGEQLTNLCRITRRLGKELGQPVPVALLVADEAVQAGPRVDAAQRLQAAGGNRGQTPISRFMRPGYVLHFRVRHLCCAGQLLLDLRYPARQQLVELACLKRLSDVAIHSCGDADRLFVFHGVCRHGDDRQRVKAGPGANRTGGGEAVHDGHLDIHQYQVEGVGAGRLEDVERLLAIGCRAWRDADLGQQGLDDLAIERLVIDDQ